jgi:orotidine-5'-phosphate decarboxylase
MNQDAISKLLNRMQNANTLACCGLDPDPSKLSSKGQKAHRGENIVFSFLTSVIDVVSPYVCAFKAQKAFFDHWDDGHRLLRETVSYIHLTQPDIPVFVDCKIGDIENTMEAYAQEILAESDINADGVVVNPYMGDDVLAPFRNFGNKAIIVLIQTSNPSASIVQDLILENGRRLWEQMLVFAIDRWNAAGNIIPVLVSTGASDFTCIRKQLPDTMPILLAGIGAQGGSLDNLKALLNSSGSGVFVNSSRGILFANRGGNWLCDIREAAKSLRNQLNDARNF